MGGVSSGERVGMSADFDEFFRSNYAQTVRLVRLLTGVEASSEDVAQEAFARVHRHFDGLERPGGYLRETVVNLCRNWHRSRSSERRRLDRLTQLRTVDPTIAVADYELLRAVDALPYRQRAIVVMRFWLDMPEAEIAAVLGCRPGTVKSSSARALARLRKDVES